MNSGLLITIEGAEGVGKSTNRQFVADHMAASGREVLLTREPGGTAEAESIRELLLDASFDLEARTEALLMFAARSEHVSKVIRPALRAGKCVISDRFVDASYAYQGGGRQLGFESIAVLDRLVLEGLEPDLTLLLDLDVAIGLQRLEQRAQRDRIEQEQVQFFERVREAYLQRAAASPERYAVVDASGTMAQVQEQIAVALDSLDSPESR